MVSKALVRRGRNMPATIAGATAGELVRQLGANEVAVLAVRHGTSWVMQQVSNGALSLTKAARRWLTAAPSPVQDMTLQSAPAATSLTLVGNRTLNGSITLRHRELVSTISVPAFEDFLQSWVVNPGNASFPYLSTIARNYDKYCFKSIRFFVVSSAPTSASGRYYLSWEPDSEDTVPSTAAGLPSGTLMAAQHSMSTTLWQTAGMSLPAMRQDKFTGPFPDSLKDHGRLIFAARTNDPVILELFVEYTVELRQPQVGDGIEVLGSEIFTAASIGSPVGVQLVRAEAVKKLRFPPGRYRVDFTIKGTGIARVQTTVTGQEAEKYIGSAVGSTEANEIALFRSSQDMILNINDTWTTLTHGSVMITPLSRDAFELLFTNMP